MRFHARSNQSGFALIEVIASAAVLGLVTIAVYGGYNATLGSSGRERARAVAASLAEQDQERLRSYRPTDLATYSAPPRIVKVPAVTGPAYTVTSTVDWISDSANGVASCTSEANLEDYLRITSTVTSGIVGRKIKAVTQRSLVAPPVGTFQQGRGTLVVRVTGKGMLPITSLPVRIVQGATNITDDTNGFGCAVFRYVPVGSYAITFSRPGYVDTNGVTNVTSSGTVSEGTLNLVDISYDRGATVLATFDTQYRGTTCTPPACPASRATAVSFETTDLPAPGYKTFPTAGPPTNQTATQASITSPLLYPFGSAYGVYAGNCTAANPQNLVPPVSPAFAKNPSGLAPGELLYPVKVRQPALNIRAVQGATAMTNRAITAQPTTGNCAGGLKFLMRSFTGTGTADVNRGWASKLPTTGNFDPGLPYGTYDVCVDNGLTGASRRRSRAGSVIVNLNSPAGSTPRTIDLNVAAQYTSGVLCPL